MTDTFRALLQELVEAWDATADFDFNDFGHAAADIVDRARALLAQPMAEWEPMPLPGDAEGLAEVFWAQPVAEGPTDDELMDLWLDSMDTGEARGSFAFTRAVLAKWGHPTPQPVADGEVAELVEWLRESLDCALQSGNSKSIKNHCRLLDLLGRPTLQPVPEPVALTDDEIEEWADACPEAPLEEMDPDVHGWRRCFTAKEFSETIRAALDRYGRPAHQPEDIPPHIAITYQPKSVYEPIKRTTTAVNQFIPDPVMASQAPLNPTPQPPADGEVAELVSWLRDGADSTSIAANANRANRIADLLERPTPQPVAEGPTIPSHYRGHGIAVYRDGFHAGYKEALARYANALPTPEATND